MELSGEYTFDGPRDTVWAYLQDPKVLTRVLPGCDELKEIGENAYEGALKVKIGPISGKFQGTIKLHDILPLEGYDLDVSGQGAPGFVKGTGGLRLEAQGDKTRMTYQGQAQIGGRIANVGQRLIDSSAKAIIRQSLDALNEMIKLSAAAPAEPATSSSAVVEASPAEAVETNGGSPEAEGTGSAPPAVDSAPAPVVDSPQVSPAAAPRPSAAVIPRGYTPPSQRQMALQVAADVTRDMIPERYFPVVAGAAGGALVLALYLLLKQLFNARD